MATFTKFNDFPEQLGKGKHDFSAHVYKVALTNTAPTAATDTGWSLGSHPAPASANGYPAGGIAPTITNNEAAGVMTVSGTQAVFTATAGGIGPFRYAILYNDSATSPAKAVVGFWDYGSSVTLLDTEPFTVKFNNTTPGTILTIT